MIKIAILDGYVNAIVAKKKLFMDVVLKVAILKVVDVYTKRKPALLTQHMAIAKKEKNLKLIQHGKV
ncbi:hypothetical protein LCGC14_2087160 [marine sediment metagenome]|uniref:Uncharacterized protein n=1 Tax=marine sediment metagenome TaxID=412755 RepID=A0A0F9HAU7_9ZZZZ